MKSALISLFVVVGLFSDVFSQANNPAKKPVPTTCTGGILNSQAIYLPVPLYPREKAESFKHSLISVMVTVTENGWIRDPTACSGPEEIRYYAESAAQRARIKPTELNGVPVTTRGILNYVFDPKTAFDAPYELPCFPTMVGQIKIINAHATKLVMPERPPGLGRLSHVSSVQVLIDENGDVESAVAVSGLEVLRKPAVEAAKQSKFRRFFACGKPRKLASILSYNFPGQ